MKCSDCKLWKTEECKGNPEAEDSDKAEALGCFIPILAQPVKYKYTKRGAIASLICGILSLAFPLLGVAGVGDSYISGFIFGSIGIIGVIIGIIYLKIDNGERNLHGRIMAICGILCGSIGFLGGYGLAIFLFILDTIMSR